MTIRKLKIGLAVYMSLATVFVWYDIIHPVHINIL